MLAFARLCVGYFIKLYRSSLIWIHLLLPVAVAGAASSYVVLVHPSAEIAASGFIQMLGGLLPLAIGISCGAAEHLEGSAGKFFNMLAVGPSRARQFVAQGFVLWLLGVSSCLLAWGLFVLVTRVVSPVEAYMIGVVFITSIAPLWIIHVVVGMRWGRSATIGVGIAEVLLALLALTGLGDFLWPALPCAWAPRMASAMVYGVFNPDSNPVIAAVIRTGMLASLIYFVGGLAASIAWFIRWEGTDAEQG